METKLSEIENEMNKKQSEDGLSSEIQFKVLTLENEMMELKKENTFLKTKGAKTCAELKANGFEESGMYDIDPSFSGSAVPVYCDMITGTTEVSHDVIDAVEVAYCEGDGCFIQEYNYSVPADQVEALILSSSSCEQEITFDCKIAPLKNNMFGFYYGWWVDRNGQKKFYFDGHDEESHVCGCYPNCQQVQSFNTSTCNCDSSLAPWWNQDSGKITNKDHLPIKSFSYGGFISNQQKAKITVGNLRCTGHGTTSVSSLTSSCSSLKKDGATVSGFYMTKPTRDSDLQVSYCRMDQMGYKDEELTVGGVMDMSQKMKMINIDIDSYMFEPGTNFSSTWKPIIDLKVDIPSTNRELKGTAIELNLDVGTLTFHRTGVYVFVNVKTSSPLNTAWQLGSGYNGRYDFKDIHYIQAGSKIPFTGHGTAKSLHIGIVPLYTEI